MERLPPEIVADVLSRLPIESLAQAKYVSKLWNSIIKTPSFAATHSSRSINNRPALIFQSIDPKSHNRDLFLLEPNNPEPHILSLRCHPSDVLYAVNVVGSSNGILWLVGHTQFGLPISYLCNPILNRYLVIPPSTRLPPDSMCVCVFGFACDLTTGDYKLLIFFGEPEDVSYVWMLEICTVNANGEVGPWRSIESHPYDLMYTYGCFLNRNLHWLALKNDDSDCIVSFDVHDEKFDVLPTPTLDSATTTDNWGIHVLGGRLCYFDEYIGGYFDVWVMKEYGKGESWVREHRITPNSSLPVYLMDNQEILMCGFRGGFFSYDPSKDVLHEFRAQFNTMGSIQRVLCHTCNIISLNGMYVD